MHGTPAKEIWKQDKKRTARLEELGYKVETVYECEIKKELEQSSDMREYFKKCKIPVL